jgi:hypothetical protein
MGNSKRALDEIRSLAGAGTNEGYQKKSWSLCLKLKEIKEFWYQCLCRKDPKVAPGQPEKITTKPLALADAFSDYEEMKKSKNVWRCPW